MISELRELKEHPLSREPKRLNAPRNMLTVERRGRPFYGETNRFDCSFHFVERLALIISRLNRLIIFNYPPKDFGRDGISRI